MDFQPLITQLPTLRAEAKRWRQQAAEATAKAESIEHIVQGIEGLAGEEKQPDPVSEAAAANGSAPDGLRGIAAVRSVMRSQPQRIWKARAVHEIMDDRGWVSPEAGKPLRGTEAAINRLFHRGEIEKVGSGNYRWNSGGEELSPQAEA